MGLNAVGEGEAGRQVAAQLLHLLDVLHKLAIDSLLHALELASPLLSGSLALLGLFKSDLGGVLELVLGEAGLLLEESVINIGSDSSEVDFEGGGNDVGGVDSPEGDAVDGVGSGDQKVAGGEGFKDDDASAPADAGKEDDD